jgi:chemotaxis-related protein WspB
MLVLQFYLGDIMYVIPCDRVKEVAPMVAMKRIPHAPQTVAGLFNYRGTIVPVIDLRHLIYGETCQLRLSTRIILVEYLRRNAIPGVFGIMAERITEAVDKPGNAFVEPGIMMKEAPYLGGVLMENNAMIQLIDLDRLSKSLVFLTMFEGGDQDVAQSD